MATDARALAIVEEALGEPDPARREALIAERCGDDAALAARVRELLALDDGDSPLLHTDSFAQAFGLPEVLPQRFGPFRVTGEIARGGMGTVLKAERDDGLFEQTVAIKLIRGDIASERARARFTEERRFLARLHHPGIVRILDGGEHEDRPWLAMDFIDGAPITHALDEQAADQTTRLAAFRAVCEAVAHAHRALVIHADIKPSNILLSRDGAVHLLDFGIAQLVQELGRGGTRDPYPLTPGYAAPERAGGSPPTIASDVFSLGMLLVEVLTGTAPVKPGATRVQPDCIPGSLVPQGCLTGDLAAIAARAAAIAPDERYPDVTSLIEDLRRHRAHLPVRARADAGWRYVAGRFVLRHRRGLALTSVIGLALVGAAVTSTVQYWRAETERRVAEARFADARGAARYLINELIPRLEKQPHALALRVEAAGKAQAYLERLAGSPAAPDSVRIEAADGLLKLAQYQARAGRPNLGQPLQAAANLRRAEAILSPLAGPEALRLLARVQLERASQSMWMENDLAAAEALAGRADATLRRVIPDPAVRLERTKVFADLRGWQGRFAEEAVLAGDGLARLGADHSRDAELTRIYLLADKGEALYYQGQPAAALPVYAERRAILAVLRRAAPDDPYLRSLSTVVEWDYAGTLLELKRFAEGERVLAAAEPDAVAAAAFDPADDENRRRLRILRNTRAQALGFLGRTDVALALLAQVRGDDERALKTAPSGRRARDFAYDFVLIGEALDTGGRKAAACAADREALVRFDALSRTQGVTGLDLTGNLKVVRERITRNCVAAGR